MKRILILLLLVTTAIQAQRHNNEQIEALKTAHITKELDLTPAEAEKFWPVYNKFDKEQDATRRAERKEISKLLRGNLEEMSDEQAKQLIDRMIDYKATQLEQYKQLISDLDGVIPPQKILKLRKAEDDFRRILMDKLRQRRGGRQ